jgi:glycine hydroxymethyltransferase
MRRDYQRLGELLSSHTEWRRLCLNLIAAENVQSPSVKAALASDLGGRYGTFKDTECVRIYTSYAGTQYIAEIANTTSLLARRVFQAEYVDIRPLSGNIADVVTIQGLTAPGETVVNTSAKDGGHTFYMNVPETCPALRRRWEHLVFDEEGVNVDVERSIELLERVKPRLVILGASHMLFPLPLREIADAARSLGAFVSYDASHVLGLIAGKEFQDPLREGAMIVHSSTHKTLGGPQGGIIFSNEEEVFERVSRVVYPALQDNPHFNRILALGVCLSEMEEFGEAYAKQVIANSKALAEALHERGFHLLAEDRGFTESHLCRVDFKPYVSSGAKGSEMLERANIIVSLSPMPGDTAETGRTGARVGVAEMTRMGMKEGEMEEIADFWKMVLIDKRDAEKVARKVADFRAGFQKVHYCFD